MEMKQSLNHWSCDTEQNCLHVFWIALRISQFFYESSHSSEYKEQFVSELSSHKHIVLFKILDFCISKDECYIYNLM